MFTGIIEKIGVIRSIDRGRLALELPWNPKELNLGQSISVNGCCLTIAFLEGNLATFELSPETLSRTTFQNKRVGDRVNLERSLQMGERVDGHFVSGHIDGIGAVRSFQEMENGNRFFWIDAPSTTRRWTAEKGSVALDGISFTINDVDSNGFSFTVIPHTSKVTTIGEKRKGDEVNLEFDLLAKYVERALLERTP